MRLNKKTRCSRCMYPTVHEKVHWTRNNRPLCGPCYDDYIWQEREKWVKPGHPYADYVVIFNGHMHMMDGGAYNGPTNMFTAIAAKVSFKNTTRVVTTVRLHYIGEIPILWRPILQDNAVVEGVKNDTGQKPKPGGVPAGTPRSNQDSGARSVGAVLPERGPVPHQTQPGAGEAPDVQGGQDGSGGRDLGRSPQGKGDA